MIAQIFTMYNNGIVQICLTEKSQVVKADKVS